MVTKDDFIYGESMLKSSEQNTWNKRINQSKLVISSIEKIQYCKDFFLNTPPQPTTLKNYTRMKKTVIYNLHKLRFVLKIAEILDFNLF